MPDDLLVLDRFIPFRLSVVTNLVSGAIASVYQSQFDLSVPEWRVIAVVAETDGLSQQAIGHRTRMEKVSVSRAAISLERRGLVERRPNPNDARSHQLHLTGSGLDLYGQVAPQAKELERAIFGTLKASEITALMALLGKVEDSVLSLSKNNVSRR